MEQPPEWRVVDWRGAAFSNWVTNHAPSRDDQIIMLDWLNGLERNGVSDTIAISSDGFPMERGRCETAVAYILEPRPLSLPERRPYGWILIHAIVPRSSLNLD